MAIILKMQGRFYIQKPMFFRLSKKNYVIILIEAEKAFSKIHYPFMMKTLGKVGIQEISYA